MNTNQGPIILAERAADDVTLRTILREWGYAEGEIQRFLSDSKVDPNPDQQSKVTDPGNFSSLSQARKSHYARTSLPPPE